MNDHGSGNRGLLPLVLLLQLTSSTLLGACSGVESGRSAGPDVAFADGTRETVLDFGAVARGERAELSAAIVNRGGGTAHVTVQPNGIASEFGFEVAASNLDLGRGAQPALTVAFSPTMSGMVSTSLALTSDDGTRLTVQLRGATGEAGCELASELPLDFGKVRVGDSQILEVEVANPGDAIASVTARLDGATDAQFALVGGGARTIEPRGTARFSVLFEASHLGAAAGALLLDGPGSCAGKRLALQASAATELQSVEPSTLDFLYVAVRNSVTRTFTVRNDDRTACTLSGFRVVGDPMFSLVDAPDSLDIPAHDVARLAVRFAPSGLGRLQAQLQFRIAGAGSSWQASLALSGRGGGPVAEVDPVSVDFGPTVPGRDVERFVTVSNVGQDVPLTTADNLAFASFDGAAFHPAAPEIVGDGDGVFSLAWPPKALPAEGLAAGSSVSLAVRFRPNATGAQQATLRIRTNDQARPVVEIPLSGGPVVAPCTATVEPSSVDFGLQLIGVQPARADVTVRNTSPDGADCLLSSISLAPATAPFSVSPTPPAPVRIAAGDAFALQVAFTPVDTASASAEFNFDLTDPTQPSVKIPITGQGTNCVAVEPNPVEFAPTTVGCSSSRTLSVWNLCSSTLTLSAMSVAPAAGPFALGSSNPGSVSVPAGRAAAIPIQFTPTAAGQAQARLTIGVSGIPAAFPQVFADLNAQTAASTSRVDTFVAPAGPQIDWLFVLDDSATMAPGPWSALANAFSYFSTLADGRPIDFHIGIARGTTDDGPPSVGRLEPQTGANPWILTTSTPNAQQLFSQYVLGLPTANHAMEDLFSAASLALSPPHSMAWNAGFQRPRANLAVVLMSDGDFWAQDAAQFGTFLSGLKERSDLGSVSTIMSPAAEPSGTPLATLVQTTGGFSVGGSSWASDIHALTGRLAASAGRYFLSSTPDLALPIAVTVDGAAVAAIGPLGETRWTAESAPPAIYFTPTSAPTAGATVTISYSARCQ